MSIEKLRRFALSRESDDGEPVMVEHSDGSFYLRYEVDAALREVGRLKAAMKELANDLRIVSVRLANSTIGDGDIQRMLHGEASPLPPAEAVAPGLCGFTVAAHLALIAVNLFGVVMYHDAAARLFAGVAIAWFGFQIGASPLPAKETP